MALQPRGNGWYMSVTVVDQQADETILNFDLQANDFASASASKNAVLAELANRTKASIKNVTTRFVEYEDTFAIPVNGADNSTKARISWVLTDGQTASQDITAPSDDTWIAPSGKNNNIVDGSVFGAWAGLFGVGGSAFISDGQTMTATPFIDGQRVSVKKGKRRT